MWRQRSKYQWLSDLGKELGNCYRYHDICCRTNPATVNGGSCRIWWSSDATSSLHAIRSTLTYQKRIRCNHIDKLFVSWILMMSGFAERQCRSNLPQLTVVCSCRERDAAVGSIPEFRGEVPHLIFDQNPITACIWGSSCKWVTTYRGELSRAFMDDTAPTCIDWSNKISWILLFGRWPSDKTGRWLQSNIGFWCNVHLYHLPSTPPPTLWREVTETKAMKVPTSCNWSTCSCDEWRRSLYTFHKRPATQGKRLFWLKWFVSGIYESNPFHPRVSAILHRTTVLSMRYPSSYVRSFFVPFITMFGTSSVGREGGACRDMNERKTDPVLGSWGDGGSSSPLILPFACMNMYCKFNRYLPHGRG